MMPQLDQAFVTEVNSALGLVRAGELVRANSAPRSTLWNEWHASRLEALHELAFLRVYAAWEVFLQESLCRYMCGYNSARFGQATPVVAYHHRLALADTAIRAGQQFVLWHNPTTVADRCASHLNGSRNEIVVRAFSGRLWHFARIRHRIAHDQDDAKQKFDNATMAMAGRRYPASRPGRFLRDTVMMGGVQVRWLDVLMNELAGLASQIV